MLRIVVQRVIQGVIVLFLVSAITFLLVNLAPGGPSSLMRMDVTAEQREALSRRLGLDEPVPVRYAQWLAGALRGDSAPRMTSNEPVGAAHRPAPAEHADAGRRGAGRVDRARDPDGRVRRAAPQPLPDFAGRAGQRAGPVGARRSGWASS